MAVACGQSQSANETHRQQLVTDIVDSHWRDDAVIQHLSNHALAKTTASAHCKLILTDVPVFYRFLADRNDQLLASYCRLSVWLSACIVKTP